MELRQFIKTAAWIVALGLFPGFPSLFGQQPSSAAADTSGTLNLILANRNGFVIAADSRRSNPSAAFRCAGGVAAQKAPSTGYFYCDDSQKVFRLGSKEAMAIAGFANAGFSVPLDLSVAPILRQQFGAGGRPFMRYDTGTGVMSRQTQSENPQEPQPFAGIIPDSSWVHSRIGQDLVAISSLFDPQQYSPSQMEFQAIYGEITPQGQVRLLAQRFHGSWTVVGPLNKPIPIYSTEQAPLATITRFTWCIGGVPFVAESVLAGIYKTDNAVILAYYSKRHQDGALNSMSVEEMSDLARAILSETRKFTDIVGGADQIGEFPVTDNANLSMPTLPREKALAPRFDPKIALKFAKDKPVESFGVPNIYMEDFQHSLDSVIPQFFLGSQFIDVRVVLDNNYFVRDEFDGVTFEFTGKPFLERNNTFKNCTIEIEEGAKIDESDIFEKCAMVRKKVILDKDMVGFPMMIEQHKGYVAIPLR